MENSHKTVELIEKIGQLADEDPSLAEVMLPALTAILVSLIEGHADMPEEDLTKYVFCMRGYKPGTVPIVTVDFDPVPMLEHLEAIGVDHNKLEDGAILALMKGVQEEEETIH